MRTLRLKYCWCGAKVPNYKLSKGFNHHIFERNGTIIKIVSPMCGDCDQEARDVYKDIK